MMADVSADIDVDTDEDVEAVVGMNVPAQVLRD